MKVIILSGNLCLSAAVLTVFTRRSAIEHVAEEQFDRHRPDQPSLKEMASKLDSFCGHAYYPSDAHAGEPWPPPLKRRVPRKIAAIKSVNSPIRR